MNENESNDVFQRFGGRKFLLSLIGMVALIIMASLNPMNLTTEVIVGVLGVIATYSGSNSMLTAIMAKKGSQEATASYQSKEKPVPQSGEEVFQASAGYPVEANSPVSIVNANTILQLENKISELNKEILELQYRASNLENAVNSLMEIVKTQNELINRLTISQNQSNLNVRGLDGKNNG